MARTSSVCRHVVAAIPAAAIALLMLAATVQPARAAEESSADNGGRTFLTALASEATAQAGADAGADQAATAASADAAQPASDASGTKAQVGQDTFSYALDASGNACITGYEGTSATLTVPTELNGAKVAAIGEGAFKDAALLAEVVIPDGSITSIASKAFEGCTGLKSVDIAPTVTTIADDAFVLAKETEVTQKDADGKDQVVKQTTYEDIAGLTILGDPESVAPEYASAHGFTFVQNRFHATSVTLNNTSVVLLKGLQTAKLTASVDPANCTDAQTWSSSDNAVATVGQDGSVTTAGLGTATVTISVGKQSATCSVQVVQPVEQINLNKATFSMEAGDVKPLLATVLPNDAYNKAVTWTSSNPAVAKVDEKGNVTGVAQGSTVITCTAADGSGVTQSAQVEVVCNQHVAAKAGDLASPHTYANSTCDTWVYTQPGATGLALTFDKQTYVESGYDYIEIYAADGSMVGKYTGSALAGATVKVPGESVKIRLVTDGSNAEWGFAVTGAEEYQPDGWSFFDGATHYYIGGYLLRGECYVGGSWRYFEPQYGAMQTGLVTQTNNTVKYYDENGLRVTGFVTLTDGTRYFDADTGAMATGLTYLPDGRVIYCGANGILRSGTFTFQGVALYFDESGVLADPASTDIAQGAIAQEDGGPAPAAQTDTQELNRAVSHSYELAEADYTPASWAKMVAARSAAEAVQQDATLTQTVCDALTAQLNDAISALEPAAAPVQVDTAALQQAVCDAQALAEADYTPASWGKLNGAVAAASAVLADSSATQTIVDAQAQLVRSAIDALQPASDPQPEPAQADTTALVDVVNKALALGEAEYSPETWANLQTAVSAAQAVLADTSATQDAVDVQAQAVQAAIDALQPATPVVTPDESTGGDVSGDGTEQPGPATDTAEDILQAEDGIVKDGLEPGETPENVNQADQAEGEQAGAQSEQPAADAADQAAQPDSVDQAAKTEQLAEYLGVLYLSAQYQASTEDAGTYQAWQQAVAAGTQDDGSVTNAADPVAWGAFAGALIGQVGNADRFASFFDASSALDRNNLADLGIQKNDDGSYTIAADKAAALIGGIVGGECSDTGYAWATNVVRSEDGASYTAWPQYGVTVEAEFADVISNADGSCTYTVKHTVKQEGAEDAVTYGTFTVVPWESSPFGLAISEVNVDESLADRF